MSPEKGIPRYKIVLRIRRIPIYFRRDKEETMVLFLAGIYTVIFSYFTILRMYALRASAWDLGNYNQALYTALFEGKLFYTTADLPGNPTGSLFGIHFSPFLILLAPLYLLYPHPETLLVIQSFFIAVGSLPTYWLARRRLNSNRWGLVFASAYLASPALMGLNWFDFHPEAFIPTSMLFIIYYFGQRNWRGLIFFFFFALSTIEQTSVVIAILAVVLLYQSREDGDTTKTRLSLFPILLLLGSLTWMLVSLSVICSFGSWTFKASEAWTILGTQNWLGIPMAVLTSPSRAFEALAFDWPLKALYLLIVLLQFGMLSLLSPLTMLPALPWLAASLLSNNPAFYTLGLQYPAFLIPFVTNSAVEGAGKLQSVRLKLVMGEKTLLSNGGRRLLFSLVLGSLIMSNPFISLNLATNSWSGYGLPLPSPHGSAAVKLVELIPSRSSVLATQFLFPLVSSGLNAFTPPISAFFPPESSFFAELNNLLNRSDYVLMDFLNDKEVIPLILARTEGKYGVLGFSDDILLLRRGYTGKPIIYEPYTQSFDYRDLELVSGSILYDADAQSQRVLARTGHEPPNSDLSYGPYVILPPGEYRASYWIKGSLNSSDQITLDVSVFTIKIKLTPTQPENQGYHLQFSTVTSGESKETLAGVALHEGDLEARRYQNFSITFTADVYGIYEFTTMNVTTGSPLFLDRIELEQIKPLPYIRPIEVQFDDHPAFIYDSHQVSLALGMAGLSLRETRPLTYGNTHSFISEQITHTL